LLFHTELTSNIMAYMQQVTEFFSFGNDLFHSDTNRTAQYFSEFALVYFPFNVKSVV
jgi:hypothetical protein